MVNGSRLMVIGLSRPPDDSTILFPLSSFLFPLSSHIKEPISFIEREKALSPTETVSYACKGLSLWCVFPIALGHGDYLFQRLAVATCLRRQRYYIVIAVHESFTKKCAVRLKEISGHFGHLVICQNRKRTVKIRHYYNKYIYLFNSEKIRVSEIDFDHFDLDHFDHLEKL